MRKGYSIGFFQRDTAEISDFLRSLAKAGFDGVEPTFLPDGWPCPEFWESDARTLKELADEAGLDIPSMRGGPLFWKHFGASDAHSRRTVLKLAEQAVRCIHEMGGNALLMVPGHWEAGQSYQKLIETVMDNARAIAPIAEEYDITVGLENIENQMLFSPWEWQHLIDEIGHPSVRMYYDVGNTVKTRQGSPPDWIRQMGRERIARIHLKDAIEGERIVGLLEGDVDWPGVRSALADIDYDNWICAELLPYKHLSQRQLERTAADIDAIWSLES